MCEGADKSALSSRTKLLGLFKRTVLRSERLVEGTDYPPSYKRADKSALSSRTKRLRLFKRAVLRDQCVKVQTSLLLVRVLNV